MVLKKLLVKHKPEFYFISEPWMSSSNFPVRWLSNLGLKLFDVNHRNNMIPNLWCLRATQVSPSLIFVDDQQISIKVEEEGKHFYIRRRNLWSTLSNIQNQYNMPWCCVGDFNTTLGSQLLMK
jgi:hypothetical protein